MAGAGPDGANAIHLLNGNAAAVDVGAPAAVIGVANHGETGACEVGFDDCPLRKARAQTEVILAAARDLSNRPHRFADSWVAEYFQAGARLEYFELGGVRRRT